MKRFFSLLLTVAAIGSAVAKPRALNDPEDFNVRWDGHHAAERDNKVQEKETINRSPLFDNAPFLRVRPGERLVNGKLWIEGGKGGRPGFFDYPAKFLKSGNRYVEIFASDHDGKLLLEEAYRCLLFDWDEVTIENAEAIKRLVKRDGELTLRQYTALVDSIHRSMPEIQCELPFFELQAPTLIDLGLHKHVVFEGIAFDDHRVRVYKYRLRVGPTVYLDLEQVLIDGPPRVDRDEFEGTPPSSAPNSPGAYTVPPEVAAAKRKEYDRMMQFKKIVREAMARK